MTSPGATPLSSRLRPSSHGIMTPTTAFGVRRGTMIHHSVQPSSSCLSPKKRFEDQPPISAPQESDENSGSIVLSTPSVPTTQRSSTARTTESNHHFGTPSEAAAASSEASSSPGKLGAGAFLQPNLVSRLVHRYEEKFLL